MVKERDITQFQINYLEVNVKKMLKGLGSRVKPLFVVEED